MTFFITEGCFARPRGPKETWVQRIGEEMAIIGQDSPPGSVRQQLSVQFFTGLPIWGCSDTPSWGDTHSLASVSQVETGRMRLSGEEGRGRLLTDLGTEHKSLRVGRSRDG